MVLAILGITAALTVSLLPRQAIAVSQAQRIFSTAVQFTRLEAIKQNTQLRLDLTDGATTLRVVRVDDPNAMLREFALNPQDGRVALKNPSDAGIVFNSRGVAIVPVLRTVSIGVIGTTQHDVALQISGQGSVRVVVPTDGG